MCVAYLCQVVGGAQGKIMRKGKYVRTEETRKKLSEAHKGNKYCLGRKYSKETIDKMKLAQAGNKNFLGHKHTEESKRKISESRKGKKLPPFSEQHRKNLSLAGKGKTRKPLSLEHKEKLLSARRGKPSWNKGKKLSKEIVDKMSLSRKGSLPWNKGKKMPQISSSNHYLWKGGITPINMQIRNSLEYKLWRTAVFERDNYTCVWCGVRSSAGIKVILNADHIKPFSLFPELRFEIDNGRTLCIVCHRKTDTFGIKILNYKI